MDRSAGKAAAEIGLAMRSVPLDFTREENGERSDSTGSAPTDSGGRMLGRPDRGIAVE
jgi:hypothetical protein